jgi:hypothetical protein
LMEGMGLGQYLFGALIHPMVYHHVPLCCQFCSCSSIGG